MTTKKIPTQEDLILAAKSAMLPERCVVTVFEKLRGEMDFSEAFKLMKEQTKEIQNGNLDKIERHLFSQGLVLSSLFELLILKFSTPLSLPEIQLYGQLALKAQNQSRVTFTALADLKNPNKTTFIKQQNNAINQQVNNQPLSENHQTENFKNELLSEENYAVLDSDRTKETITAYPQMEAVGALHRSQNECRD